MLWMMGVNRCHVGRLTSEKKEKTENVLHSKIDYDCCVCVCVDATEVYMILYK
jgi:hypothetical protein